ncbi:polyribonucleotide nucleotidyltransferase [Desulfosalsimonas propionicica]|uniref:Polyribonucleotide nucleotidyltransferase n=1 Tax=Desulfosalsimonas propionicica TaxID=332175 RepID=A0A7W0C600_9BACT|nr:polyribonucleotide nucleotidyltransferase [Desulfosalsimonas propionicica]MBA2879766.1 polyribonucleotide nucleotidyltransferase [Desulfosalsimonas propionicica]
MEISFKTQIGGETLSIQAGKLAKQASGSVLVQYGETMVLVTAVSNTDPRPDATFLPLTVEYQEKIYAAGRIPGNYFRREIGRPSEKETLTSRLIDRPIRPLFPKGYNYETQVIATVLSMDKQNEPDVLAMIGASAALELSDIPFDGPIACVRVGRIEGSYVINPAIDQWEQSDINLIVAGSRNGIIMVEGGGDFVSEAEMIEAIFFAHKEMQPLIDIQEKLRDSMAKEKRSFALPEKDASLAERLEQLAADNIRQALTIADKLERRQALSNVKKQAIEDLGEEFAERQSEAKELLGDLQKQICRDMILKEGKRIDNRATDQVRPISCETAPLPRVHGSALFTRGETQVLAALTLGSGQDEQRVETLLGDETYPFLLHYNFPPYSVGEVKRPGGPSRRDIGHGALAKRAIEKVIPAKETFDYTIRLVSEVLESNGSSSMATVCASSLALMDGGVPVTAPVSGIAMGLITDGEKSVVLSDILGDEDQFGDMDFKVAGTRKGITALQMDIKIKELSRRILETALDQAKRGRLHILDRMEETLNAPREELSPYAPNVTTVQISPERIGELIGPGGKHIRQLQNDTNTQIEINDSGLVKIAAFSKEEGEAAAEMVRDIGSEPEIGQVYEGTVVRITDFGAFVQIKAKTEGLVHISELAHYRVKSVSDIVKEGDKLQVKVIDIRDGKIRLSHKALLEAPAKEDGESKSKDNRGGKDKDNRSRRPPGKNDK